MRILFLGDVVGRTGREAVLAQLPRLKSALKPDAIVINGENAAGGFGITEKIAREFFDAGAHAITTGNHVWDQRELLATVQIEPRILRPLNYPAGTPGKGASVITLPGGRKILVINVMLRLFMDAMDDPFQAVNVALQAHRLGSTVHAVLVDVHGEATSEKMAMGHFLDGRASLVVGTHTHVPTADVQVLPGGTAYQSDAGMCGDYDSVIGMRKEPAIARFTRKLPGEKLTPAEGEATVCGIVVDTDDRTGLATRARPVRVGGRLLEELPAD